MSVVGALSGREQWESARRWFVGQLKVGYRSAGHMVGVLALIGQAAYALLVASASIRVVPEYSELWKQVFGAVGWLLWFGAYVWSVARVLRGRRRRRATQVVAIVGLVWSMALYTVMGMSFAVPPSLSLSVTLLCLAGRVRGVTTVLLLAVYFGLTTRDFDGVGNIMHNFQEFALSTLIFYAIPRLVIFAGELEDTRSELAQLAVAEQRLRWARDLHDTLGHGLSVVALKLELVERLSGKDPQRATDELRDARTLLRESIGEMQTVVAGMRDVSLEAEIANARATLGAAGVALDTDLAPVALDGEVAEALAWIVREGTTNVLRHSDSAVCRVSLRVDRDRVALTLANDGPAIKVTSSPSGGHGIRGMRERLDVLGGRLTAKSRQDGGFVLEASVPLPATVGAEAKP